MRTRGSAKSFICVLLALAVVLLLTRSERASAQDTGVIFGAYAQPIDGQTNERAIELLERDLGSKLPMVRAFGKWDDEIGQDKRLHRWIRDGGRDLMTSVKPKREDGSIVTWQEIASARPGTRVYREMQDLASGARRYGAPMILAFHHEPEQQANRVYGTSQEFRSAFRALRAVFDAEGVENVHFAWVMTEWSFEVADINPNDRRRAESWYPGDDVVDMIAADVYNWNNCRGTTTEPWRTLEANLEPLLRFSSAHPDKPLVLAELGSDEGPPGAKGEWLDAARNLFKQDRYRDTFAAVLYFHDDGREEDWPECDWWLNSSANSLAAAQRWAADDFYRGVLSPPDKPVPLPRCAGRRVTIAGTAGDDILTGTEGPDVIHGGNGDDTINGLRGDDTICGGAGNDTLLGSGGADALHGGAGADFVLGGYGPDTLVGGTGPDRMNGQHGNDELWGDDGRDVLRGGPHQDLIRGGAHGDVVLGQGGFDVIFGDGGNDRLVGGVGADQLHGGSGVDDCVGGPGRDTVSC